MAVTIANPIDVGPNAHLVRWTSDLDDPIYRVYIDGVLVRCSRRNWERVTVTGASGALLEVLDAATTPVTEGEGPVTLHWPAVAAAAAYRVEEYVGETWITRGVVRASGHARETWRSAPLSDAAAHPFRVTPIGTNGNAGTPGTLTVKAPRHPAPPAVSFQYNDSSHKVTVSAA